MNIKKPNNGSFPPDESPVPLPPIAEAWKDMRRKLDAEMPERRFAPLLNRAALALMLVLLPLGMAWFIGQGRAGVPGRIGQTTVKSRQVKTGEQREEGQVGSRGAERPNLESRDRENQNTRNQNMESRQEMIRNTGQRGKRAPKTRVIVDSRLALTDTQGEDGSEEWKKWADPAAGRASAGTHNNKKAPVLTKISPALTKNHPAATRQIPPAAASSKPKNAGPRDSTRILYAAGLADNKSFPVGAQQPVDLNSNLKKDIWFDYVPSPYFQYYPSRKIGFQIGVQFNSPQYTESVSIYRKAGPVANGGSGGGRPFSMDTVVLVKKLYYFNFPLIVYYSPFRNLNLGVGLQFSNLRNGVAFQNNVVHYTGPGFGGPDTVTKTQLVNLKEDGPAYQNLRRNEWRALFEANYYWKRVSLGLQYQQALTDYLYAPVQGSSGKDRNSSFNLYLRYNLWERRIKIPTR